LKKRKVLNTSTTQMITRVLIPLKVTKINFILFHFSFYNIYTFYFRKRKCDRVRKWSVKSKCGGYTKFKGKAKIKVQNLK